MHVATQHLLVDPKMMVDAAAVLLPIYAEAAKAEDRRQKKLWGGGGTGCSYPPATPGSSFAPTGPNRLSVGWAVVCQSNSGPSVRLRLIS